MMLGKRIEKVWGHEEVLIKTDRYSSKKLVVKQGYVTSMHYHKVKDETFYILNGELELKLKDRIVIMTKGDIYRLPPNTQHSFRATSKVCKILEISYCPVEGDNYRLNTSRKL